MEAAWVWNTQGYGAAGGVSPAREHAGRTAQVKTGALMHGVLLPTDFSEAALLVTREAVPWVTADRSDYPR
jgi:hypothetical protein